MNLLSQIAAIAAPIVKQYHNDIAVHDARVLASFRAGDSAVWLCYDCGSHLARLSWSERMTIVDRLEATRHSLNLFDAVNSVWPGRQWHFLESTGDNVGTVRSVSTLEARALFVAKIRELEESARPRKLSDIPGAEFRYRAGVTLSV